MIYQGGRDARYRNILNAAATSGDKDTWEAVLAELARGKVEVTPTQNRTCLEAKMFELESSGDNFCSPHTYWISSAYFSQLWFWELRLLELLILPKGKGRSNHRRCAVVFGQHKYM